MLRHHKLLPIWLLFITLAYPLIPIAAPEHKENTSCTVIEIFSRQGCPHCANAYRFLEKLKKDNPYIEIISRDIDANKENMQRFIDFNARFVIDQPGVPSFLVCDNFLIGFDHTETTGKQLNQMLHLETFSTVIANADEVDLPVIGKTKVENLGMPLFTIAIGLVDGFNPCAMWVLLVILSILVNLRDRKRILLIAGTFVVVSGIVYFFFMAAWLNLFLIIGVSRALQFIIGLVAMLIGTIHIKDYLAFKKGLSLSIPDTAKPSLYSRIRDIVYAKNIVATFIAIVIMATLVNLIELLCTAGLPAVYTQVLSLQKLNSFQYYLYLLLYNIAYMFDDALMVGIVVFTLSKRKIGEQHGRWLKLLSGSVILILGVLLILNPSLLI